jgi:hypothetical protein
LPPWLLPPCEPPELLPPVLGQPVLQAQAVPLMAMAIGKLRTSAASVAATGARRDELVVHVESLVRIAGLPSK